MKHLILTILLVIFNQFGFAQGNSIELFTSKMEHTRWKTDEAGFKYPVFFTKTELMEEELPAYFDIYTWGKVNYAYSFMGNWATDISSYPKVGMLIYPAVKVKSITYINSSSTIYSGYTSDNRIFYLKRKITTRDAVPHAKLLVLLYPKAYQKGAKHLIEQIKKW